MGRVLSGCLKLVLLPVLLALILLALIGAGVTYVWASRYLLQPAPLVGEVTDLGLIRDKLLNHELKSVRQALLDKQNGRFDLKLGEKELTALVGANLPSWLSPSRVELGLETDKQMDLHFSRKWNEAKWLNLDGQALVEAEQGDFTVQIHKLRIGSLDCPGIALGQVSHLLELVLEKDPSLAQQPWRIPDFHVERGRVRLIVETWPK